MVSTHATDLGLFDRAPVGLVHAANDGGILAANAAFARLVGVPAGELLVGRSLGAFFTVPGSAHGVGQALAEAVPGTAIAAALRRDDGSAGWVEFATEGAAARGAGCIAMVAEVSAARHVDPNATAASALFRTVADAAPVMLWMIGPSQDLRFVNRLWREFTGRTMQEEESGSWVEGLHPDDRDLAAEAFGTAFAARREVRTEYRLRRNDGAYRWVLDTGTPLFGLGGQFEGFVGGCVDIHDAKQAQDVERAASEARFRALFENSGVAMLVIGAASRAVLDANPAAVALYGFPREALLTKRLEDLSTSDAATIARNIEVDRREHRHGTVFRHRTASGDIRDVEIHTSLVEDGGQGVLYSIVHDVTDRERLERELRHVQKMESVGRLAGGVAHEINNDLAVVMANASLLVPDLDRLGDAARECVGEIVDAATRSAAMVEKLQALARQRHIERRPFALGPHVVAGVAALQRSLPASITVTCVDRLEPGDVVDGDAAVITQVLGDLVTNARDAMPDGGTLEVTCALAADEPGDGGRPSARSPGRFAVLSVADTGIGMSPAVRDRLFEPFFTTKPLHSGGGLGLAMVYGAVKQHDGYIEVESTPREGTVVRVYLPLAELVSQAPAAAPPRPKRARGATILVVEDAAPLRRATARVLEREGYTVLVAADGEEALRLFGEHEASIALVLSDVVMPRLDGRGLYEALRAQGAQVPVVLMSGYSGEDVRRGGRLDPSVPLLAKPWRTADLLRVLRGLLDPPEPPAA